MFFLHHVSISVISIEDTIRFYSCFGFKESFRWRAENDSLTIAHLKLGEFFLELFCYSESNPAPEHTKNLESDLKVIGIRHFGLKVDDIEKSLLLLQAEGLAGKITPKLGRTNIRYFFITDPNGIFVEIVQDDRSL